MHKVTKTLGYAPEFKFFSLYFCVVMKGIDVTRKTASSN